MNPLLFLLLLLAASCSAEAPPKPVTPVAKAKPAQDPNPYPVYSIAVAASGLSLTDPKTKTARPADFGLRQSLLLAILARTIGPAAEGHDKACKRDYARWPNGLTLWFDAGDFTGWSLEGDSAAIGIAPGMSRKPAMAAGVTCRQTSGE